VKRIIAMIFALVLLFSFASTAFAVTLQGEVHLEDPSSYLHLRKGPSTSYQVVGYMQHGTVVDMLDLYVNGTSFHKIRGWSYLNHSSWTGGDYRTGYAHSDYIWGYGR